MQKVALGLLTAGIMGAIAFYVVQILVSDLCSNTDDWSTITETLFCTIFPVAVCIAVIILVFNGIGNMKDSSF